VYAKSRCASLRIKKALGIFGELITTTRRRTTRVAFWDPPSGSKKRRINYQGKRLKALTFSPLLCSVDYVVPAQYPGCPGKGMTNQIERISGKYEKVK